MTACRRLPSQFCRNKKDPSSHKLLICVHQPFRLLGRSAGPCGWRALPRTPPGLKLFLSRMPFQRRIASSSGKTFGDRTVRHSASGQASEPLAPACRSGRTLSLSHPQASLNFCFLRSLPAGFMTAVEHPKRSNSIILRTENLK